METGRTFVIDGKRHHIAMYVITLVLIAVSLIILASGTLDNPAVGIISVLCCLGLHAVTVYRMTEKITLDKNGVHYKIANRQKSYAWADVRALGIARARRRTVQGSSDVYTMYISDKPCAKESAWYDSYGSIRMKIPFYAVDGIACELRDFARLYTDIDPQIAEKW